MAGTASSAIVSMEVLTEEDEVAPMRVGGKARLLPVARPVTAVVRKEQLNQAPGKLGRGLSEIHSNARADRDLHSKTVTIKVVVALKGFDQEIVDRKPHGAAPIRVATENRGSGFSGSVISAEFGAASVHDKGMLAVDRRKRPDPIRRKEFALVEQTLQYAFEPLPGGNGEQFAPLAAVFSWCRIGDLMPEIGPVLEEPVHALFEAAQLLNDLVVQNRDGKKRNDTDHGTGANSVSFAANIDAVIVEAICFVPQPGPPKIVYSISDGDKVF